MVKFRCELVYLETEIHPVQVSCQMAISKLVSTLIYTMGFKAKNIFKSFTFGRGEKEGNHGTELAKFDEYFIPATVGAKSFIRALYLV